MANYIIKDGYGAEKVMAATGSGTQADPLIPTTTFESDVVVSGVMVVNGGITQTDDIKVTMDGETITLPAANLDQQASAASLSVTPATDVADATYIGDIKFGEALPAGTALMGKVSIDQVTANANEVVVKSAIPAGTNNIGDVDVASLPSAQLGQQAMAASVSVVPASDVTDATYIGDIKFGEELPAGTQNIGDVDIASELPAGTQLIGKVGIDQVSANANEVVVKSITAGSNIIGQMSIDQTTPGTTNAVVAGQSTHDSLQCNANLQVGDADVSSSNAVPVDLVGTKGTISTAHSAIDATTTSSEIDCGGYNALLVETVVTTAVKLWTVAVSGCLSSGGTFGDCYDGGTAMSYQTNSSRIAVWEGIPRYIKIVATEDEDGGNCTVRVQPLMI